MNTLTMLKSGFFGLILPALAWGQTGPATPTPPSAASPANPAMSGSMVEEFGPAFGDRELTLGANGVSNKDFDDSFGGLNFSLGRYLSDALLGSVRQTVNYANPNVGGVAWNGSTRLAFDRHFGAGALRPFLGINAGRIYGESVRDTWAAGLEGGGKYYVKPKTFVYAMADYAWLAQHARDIDDTFDDGQVTWSAGIGFNF